MTENPPTLQRKYLTGGEAIAEYLTTMSASGFVLTDINQKPFSTTLTLTRTDRPDYAYYTFLPTKYLFQPDGWTYAFSDRQGAYFRVPLPAPSETRRANFVSGDVEEETLWLEMIAEREGKMLFSANGMNYTFLPFTAKDGDPPLRYRVFTFEDIVQGDSRSDLLLKLPDDHPYVSTPQGTGVPTNEPDTDSESWYFVCVSSGSVTAAYYASRPCPFSQGEGQPMTADAYVQTHRIERPALSFLVWLLILLLPNRRGEPWEDSLWIAILLSGLAVIYAFYRLCVNVNLKKLYKAMTSRDPILTVPKSPRDIPISGFSKRMRVTNESSDQQPKEIPDPHAVEAARRAADLPMPSPGGHVFEGQGSAYQVPPPKEQSLDLHVRIMRKQGRGSLAGAVLCAVFALLSVIQVVGICMTPPLDWFYAILFVLSFLVWALLTVALMGEAIRTKKRIRDLKRQLSKGKNDDPCA